MELIRDAVIENHQNKTIPFREESEILQANVPLFDFLSRKEPLTEDEVQYAKSMPDFINKDERNFERKKLLSLTKRLNQMIYGAKDKRLVPNLGNVALFDNEEKLWSKSIGRLNPQGSTNSDNNKSDKPKRGSKRKGQARVDILLVNNLQDVKKILDVITKNVIIKAIVRIGNPFDKTAISNVKKIVAKFQNFDLIKFSFEHRGDSSLYIVLTNYSPPNKSQAKSKSLDALNQISKSDTAAFGSLLKLYTAFCADEVRKLKREYHLRYEFARTSGICKLKQKQEWPKVDKALLKSLGLTTLEPLNNERAIKEMGPMRTSEKTTKFLKEIGWQPTQTENTSGPKKDFPRSELIRHIVKDLQKLLPDFDKWRVTDTDPVALWKTITIKRDIRPVERHPHHKLIWAVYDAVKEHLLEKDMKIKFLTKEEAAQTMNRSSSVGANRTMGNFIDSGDYKGQVDHYEKCLFEENPTKSVYNCIAVPERKKDVKHPRLIWTCSGAMRIYETMVLGDFDRVIKCLPYTISGVPKAHYGDELIRIMIPGLNNQKPAGEVPGTKANRRTRWRLPSGSMRHAVCDDISGWDSRVSLSLLTMEANVAMALASSQKHKQAIELLYRIYAYSMVTILRPFTGKYAGKKNPEVGHADRVLFQLQGQVASGRRVTYSMNTLTNLVLCMARAAYSYKIKPDNVKRWALGNLRKGHTAEFGGKIHGDDSVVIMSPENALKYATLGPKFMDKIGMKLKGVEPSKSSKIARRMEEIDFCSHGFVRVEFPATDDGKFVRKWLQARSQTTIIAKAELMDEELPQEESQAAAKGKAYHLLVDYFHDDVIRTLALAILSAIPSEVKFSDRRFKAPVGPLKAVNNNLFHSRSYKIKSLDCLTQVISMRQLWYDEIDQNDKIYRDWRLMLGYLILDLREKGKSYTDYLPYEIHKAKSNPNLIRDLKQSLSKAMISKKTIRFLARKGKHKAAGWLQNLLATC